MRDAMAGWNPQRYAQFSGLRLRPALDLIGALPALPAGDVVDLGCGAGAVAEPLQALADGRRLIGVDNACEMIARARDTGLYDVLVQQDLSAWQAEAPPALICSNAALNWVPEHGALIARLVAMLEPDGVLAVQVPRQSARPSHALWRDLSGEMFPERFNWVEWESEVHAPGYYAELLNGLGECRVWETEYYQRLEPSQSAHGAALYPIHLWPPGAWSLVGGGANALRSALFRGGGHLLHCRGGWERLVSLPQALLYGSKGCCLNTRQ
ncbi:MAG: methyltransferase domain-containing protein [Pseudomonadota bacterium]